MRADGIPAASPEWQPVLPAQHGMILNYMRFPDDGVDIIQCTLDWIGPLEREPFEEAWHAVARRHSILRTTFHFDDDGDELIQVVQPDASIDIRWLDLPRPLGSGSDEPFESFLLADRREQFDLAAGPVVRLTVLRRAGPGGRAVLTFHHALLDGRSLRLLVDEVSAAYAAGREGRAEPDQPRPAFGEFVRWWHMTADPSASEQFWTDYLAGTVLPRPLPGYLGPPVAGTAEPMTAQTVLSLAESELIRDAASSVGLSASTMVSAAWALLRARYGGVNDVVIAVTRSCRRDSIPDADDIIGLLINTVPLRVRFDDEWTAAGLLTAVNQGIRQIRAHQRTPMGSALAWAGLPADTAVVDSLVMFDRRRLSIGLLGGDAAPSSTRLDRLPSYPLTLMAYDEPQLHLSLIWDRSRFADGAAERMLGQLRATLIEFAGKLAVPLTDLDLGRAAEIDILARWNRARDAYPADATIPALFAAQVASYPDAPALVFGTGAVTYAELDRRSNALAWVLRRRGVGADVPVAVAIERSADLIVALVAVLKAGGAYLPIDIGNPATRVTAMIAAAGARLVLVSDQTAATVPGIAGVETISVGAGPGQAGLDDDDRATPPDVSHPLSLAYLSFTSGSTGVPKGVAVPHRAVVRLISDPTFASLGPGERLLHLAPVAFDASTLEIWGALLTGGTVVVAPPGPLGLPEIASLLRAAKVTVAWLTAGLFHQLAEVDIDAIAGIGVVLAGGDVLNPVAVRAVLAARQGRPLVNGYGPTENTTFTACHVMTEPSQVGPAVPIGRPIQHTTVHITDQLGRPAPIGVVGELHAGGDGLARGYAGNPAATARAFVPDPAGTGTRLYRTGDLARWCADGTIEFVGRVDDQIKIRGFRVEPGEVAAALRTHPGVREAVVIVAGEGAERHLIGYVTPADGADSAALRPSVLHDFLAYRLPDYLVPTGFKAVDRLPLNANGKVDRAALPPPEAVSGRSVTPPRGATEERLAEIWRVVLPADVAGGAEIGREDSFFALGGNSLLAARLMFRIRETFEVDLRMAAFYDSPTLAACAAGIDSAREASAPSAEQAADQAAAAPGGATRPAAASQGIGRRDRSAYRVGGAKPAPEASVAPPQAPPEAPVEAPGGSTELAPHLLRLTDDWAIWRPACLRAAGFPYQLLAALGDADLARAADAVLAARAAPGEQASDPGERSRAEASYAAEFPAAVGRLSAALYEAANLPSLREAVAWQNRHGLSTGIDPLVRRGPVPPKRNGQHRQHEALVASYLQRYCAKNDTIGFFGPVCWTEFDDDSGIRVTHSAPGQFLAERVTYLEGWAVQAILADRLDALRPWLVPRRMPFVGIDGKLLRLPLAPPHTLTQGEAAVLRACDGIRDANAVAAVVLADPSAGFSDVAEVFALLGRLADSRRIAWRVEAAPQDTRPERSMLALLSRVTDDSVREPAERAIKELIEAKDELAGAAGDAARVATAMAGLEATFTRLTGAPPTRRAGELYAGRTLAYEECRRGDVVRLGSDVLDGIRDAMGMVLDSARWFTTTIGELYKRLFDEAHRERAAALGTDVVPFADFWLLIGESLFDQPPKILDPVVDELTRKWAAILDPPPGARRVQLSSADLRERVAREFPAEPMPWAMGMHHSPDLMIAGADAAAGGRLTWVLGEVHPSLVTSRYATWLQFDGAPEIIYTAMRQDMRGRAIWFAETGERGGTNTRLSNMLPSPGDIRLVYAHDSFGYDPATTVVVGDCDVISSPTGLRVHRRDGTFDRDLLEVVGDLIVALMSHCLEIMPPSAYTPRITVDDLVLTRERWTFAATDPAFADTTDESVRYLQARQWAAAHGLPRYVFVRFAGERKPIYADLTSLASIDLIARSLRRSRRDVGPGATVNVVEMVPAPDEAWLTDAQGQRYTSELRMVAADQKMGEQMLADQPPAVRKLGHKRQEG